MEGETKKNLSFFDRLGIGWSCLSRALGDASFAHRANALLHPVAPPAAPPKPAASAKPVEVPPEKAHASGLFVLSILQREGRLIDFLQEDVSSFSDADVGAAARVVHAGCRKVISQNLKLAAILNDAEGASITVPAGFDAQRIRLTGNVAGQPPFRGTLKHHGWVATEVRFPALPEALDHRVLASAEVEI